MKLNVIIEVTICIIRQKYHKLFIIDDIWLPFLNEHFVKVKKITEVEFKFVLFYKEILSLCPVSDVS